MRLTTRQADDQVVQPTEDTSVSLAGHSSIDLTPFTTSARAQAGYDHGSDHQGIDEDTGNTQVSGSSRHDHNPSC